jgi:hypothetical protein
MMGASSKVSLHADGTGQWSLQSEWYAKNRPGQPNRARHIDRWRWSYPAGSTATHVFRISVPASELCPLELNEDLANVTWLAAPGSGRKLTAECYVAPLPVAAAPIARPDFLCALDMSAHLALVVLTSDMPVSTDDANALALLRSEAMRVVTENGLEPRASYRLVAFFRDDNNVRGMVECVPFPHLSTAA